MPIVVFGLEGSMRNQSALVSGICSLLSIVGSADYATADQSSSAIIRQVSFHSPDLESATNFDQLATYQLDLSIDDNLEGYELRQTVTFRSTGSRAIDHLVFHLPNNASHLRAKGEKDYVLVESVKVSGIPAKFELKGMILSITPATPLPSGSEVRVELELRGNVPVLPPTPSLMAASIEQLMELMNGGHDKKHNYGLYGLSDGILGLNLFYAILPRKVDGTFDVMESSGTGDLGNFDAANYAVDVSHPANVVLAASGSMASPSLINQGRSTTRFVGSALRDFTLLGSTNFKTLKKSVDGTHVSVYVLDSEFQKGEKILDVASESLRIFSKLFGNYPYRDLRIVEAPIRGGAGGMEYSTLVTISKQLMGDGDLANIPMLKELLKNKNLPNIDLDILKDSLEFTVAHEVAHQWWHGLVGNDEKRNPFIDEALTNYSTILYFEKRYGAEKAKAQESMQLEMAYRLFRLMGGKDLAANSATTNFKDGMQYGAIVYSKGALFYRALRSSMGDQMFFGMLRKYADTHRFGFSNPQIVKAAIGNSDREGDKLYSRWVDGTYGDQDIGTIKASQVIEIMLGKGAFEGEQGAAMRNMMDSLQTIMEQVETN